MGQSVDVSLFYDGVWNAAPGMWSEGPLTCQVGPDPDAGVQANRLDLVLNNDDLRYDPENVSSPLYGKIGRSTPIRVRVDGGVANLFFGEVTAWVPDRTPEHVPGVRGKAWCSITAEGPLGRIMTWEDPLRPPLNRTISAYNAPGELLGYYPMDDLSNAEQISNLAPGGVAATWYGSVSLNGAAGPPGSDRVVQVGTGGSITGSWARPKVNLSGWQVGFACKLDALPPSATLIPMARWQTTAGHIYTWYVSNINFAIFVTTADGTVLNSTSTAWGSGVDPSKWTSYRFKITDIGTQVQVDPAWYTQDGTVFYGITMLFTAANPGLLVDWATVVENAAFGHWFAVSSTTLGLNGAAMRASFDGYNGENAWLRFNRLLTEEGYNSYILGDYAKSPAMGRQRPASLFELLKECAATDGGVFFDDAFTPPPYGITNSLRNYRQGLAPTLALTYPGHITPPIGRRIGPEGTWNDVTLDNAGRSTFSIQADTGPLSTQLPPAGVGRRKRSLDVNLYRDTQLADRGTFELSLGQVGRARYASLTVDLLVNPGLLSSVYNMRPGAIVSITGLEPETVYLMLHQYTMTITDTRRFLTMKLTPADVFQTGLYDAATALYDTSSTTLAAGATSTATALSLTTVYAADCLPTTGTPYALMIAGERVTVTAMTAPAGTGPFTQTATVTRSANGVVKAQLINAEVHIRNPIRYA